MLRVMLTHAFPINLIFIKFQTSTFHLHFLFVYSYIFEYHFHNVTGIRHHIIETTAQKKLQRKQKIEKQEKKTCAKRKNKCEN